MLHYSGPCGLMRASPTKDLPMPRSPVLRTLAVSLALALPLAGTDARAQHSEVSRAVDGSLAASAAFVLAGGEVLVAGSELVVVAVRPLGQALEVTLAASADGSVLVLELGIASARSASLATGASIRVVTHAAGFLLVSAGEVLAFVPDALAAGLIHHRRLDP
jgi:hypothetical protein